MRQNHSKRAPAIDHDRRGVAALEFALVSAVMVMLLVAAYDLGGAVQQTIRLAEAARAGGQYAMSYPTMLTSGAGCPATSNASPAAPNSAACAVAQALPSDWSSDLTTTITCTCWSSGTGYTTVTSCSSASSCGASAGTARFVTIQASRPFSTLIPPVVFDYSSLTSSSASYVVRIQ